MADFSWCNFCSHYCTYLKVADMYQKSACLDYLDITFAITYVSTSPFFLVHAFLVKPGIWTSTNSPSFQFFCHILCNLQQCLYLHRIFGAISFMISWKHLVCFSLIYRNEMLYSRETESWQCSELWPMRKLPTLMFSWSELMLFFEDVLMYLDDTSVSV